LFIAAVFTVPPVPASVVDVVVPGPVPAVLPPHAAMQLWSAVHSALPWKQLIVAWQQFAEFMQSLHAAFP
jgi:hypothetical protein